MPQQQVEVLAIGDSHADESHADIEIPNGLEALAGRYLASRLRELPLLREHLDRAEFDQIRRLSHNLKGTGTSYGFPDITRLGAGIEQASKDQDAFNIAQQLISLAAYVNFAAEQLGVANPL